MSRGGHSLPRSLARTSSSASRASRSASTANGRGKKGVKTPVTARSHFSLESTTGSSRSAKGNRSISTSSVSRPSSSKSRTPSAVTAPLYYVKTPVTARSHFSPSGRSMKNRSISGGSINRSEKANRSAKSNRSMSTSAASRKSINRSKKSNRSGKTSRLDGSSNKSVKDNRSTKNDRSKKANRSSKSTHSKSSANRSKKNTKSTKSGRSNNRSRSTNRSTKTNRSVKNHRSISTSAASGNPALYYVKTPVTARSHFSPSGRSAKNRSISGESINRSKKNNRSTKTNRSETTSRSISTSAASGKSINRSAKSILATSSNKSNRSAKINRSRKNDRSAKINRSNRSAKSNRSISASTASGKSIDRSKKANRSGKINRSTKSNRSISTSAASGKSINRSKKTNRSKKANRSTQSNRSTSLPPVNRLAATGSTPPSSQSADDASNQPAGSSSDQSRGRSTIRNRDVFQRRRRSSSVDATTPIPITQTPNLSYQDGQFEKLRRTPSTNTTEWNRRFPEGHVVIYTDGSKKDESSSMGIYMGPNHPLNRAQRVDGPPHCSDRADILAVILALRNLREWPQYNNEKVILRTDSWGMVKAANNETWGPAWFRRMANTYPQEIKELREEAASFPQGVTFEHVHAHCGDPGNEAADDLARQVTVGPSRSRSTPRDRSREPGRRRSLSNDPDHIRTHSAFVPPEKDINNNDQ